MPSHQIYFKVGHLVQYMDFNCEYIIRINIELHTIDSLYEPTNIDNVFGELTSYADSGFNLVSDIFYI